MSRYSNTKKKAYDVQFLQMIDNTTPIRIPGNAVPLAANEKELIRKYMGRIEAARAQMLVAQESLNDIGMSIAARAGGTATEYQLSADLGCLIPKE